MSHRRSVLRQAGATLVALALPGFSKAAAPHNTPAQPAPVQTMAERKSLYQLRLPLTDQLGAMTWWGEFGDVVQKDGKRAAYPRLASMFYTRCDMVCPMLFESIRLMESTLTVVARQRLRISLVTLDPERDDIASLKQTADLRGGDTARWRLYRSDTRDVRKIAGLLGVQYRQLGSGDFSHSTPVVLLDAQGVEVGRTEQITRPDPGFLKLLAAATASPALVLP